MCFAAVNTFQFERFSLSRCGPVNLLFLKDLSFCMRAYIRPKQLPTIIGARMSADEAKRVRSYASAAGLSVSEWTRRTLLESAECPPWARLMLAEFLALRSVVVDLQRDLIQGVNPSTERVKAILDVAEMRKFALADGRLATLRAAKETVAK